MSANIKELILVASGKGGVGKSTVALNLALALAGKDGAKAKVGLLDADIYGPSLPTMSGLLHQNPEVIEGRIQPFYKFGLKLMSIGYLVDADTAMIWRGPMASHAVWQLYNDVEWGDLDYLIFDLPPGTGDIQLTLTQKLPVTGSVLVTTPQPVALTDVRRAKVMFDKVEVPIVGVIENMSHFVCDGCGKEHAIFATGGGEKEAEQLGLNFLGKVPLETAARVAGDLGEPILYTEPTSQTSKAFQEIAQNFLRSLNEIKEIYAAKRQKQRIKQALKVMK